jgi:hypothetical protein
VSARATPLPGHRCPTGSIDAEVRVTVALDASEVPCLELAMFRRSPTDCAPSAFQRTAECVRIQKQFGPMLLAAIRRALESQ